MSSNSAPDEEVVLATLQAGFDMDGLTIYLPVTFDKLRYITKGEALLQSVKKFVKSRSFTNTPTGRSSNASTDAESPSQSSKNVSCSENVWLFQPRCGRKSSNYFTKDTLGSNA